MSILIGQNETAVYRIELKHSPDKSTYLILSLSGDSVIVSEQADTPTGTLHTEVAEFIAGKYYVRINNELTELNIPAFLIAANEAIENVELAKELVSLASTPTTLNLPIYYDQVVNRAKYQIFKRKTADTIHVVLNNIALLTNGKAYGSIISISTTGINGNYSNSVIFNNTNFPNLPVDARIDNIFIIPFTRNVTTSQSDADYRICITTTFGLCYHNFPARGINSDGVALEGDITKFDESVIWDLPERKYPSSNVNALGVERYMPGLPADRYVYYPLVNNNNGYDNGGWGNSITKGGVTFPRFYQPGRTFQTASLSPMGGYEPGSKITLLGTYKSNTAEAVRICLFATDDGGRSWYNKYEFATSSNLNSTAINTSGIVDNYITNSFAVTKRSLVSPTAEVKEPASKFTWGDNVIVSAITKGATTVIETSTAHGLITGNIIAFKINTGNCIGWDWLLNNTISTTSGGNGVLFGVKVLSATTFEIYEYVNSAFNNITCRHIHFINRVKSGWLFGTGEEYPNGFVFYMEMLEADSFDLKFAYEDFVITRLTSTPTSLQRLLGATMLSDSTIIAATDSATIPIEEITLPDGRIETINVNSTGIYKGKLIDIDNINLYEVIYEAKEPAYFFKEKGDAYIFIGQRGEFAISFDKGITWKRENILNQGSHFMGESGNFVIIDNFVIVIK